MKMKKICLLDPTKNYPKMNEWVGDNKLPFFEALKNVSFFF